MMICKADFEELFPELFAEKPRTPPAVVPDLASDARFGRGHEDTWRKHHLASCSKMTPSRSEQAPKNIDGL